MITGKIIPGTTISSPTTVYTSSGSNAVTTIILCNTGTPSLTDESSNSIDVNIYLVSPSSGGDNASTGTGSLVVSRLTVPAGETVFFSEERIVLSDGDLVRVGYQMSNGASAVSNLLTVTVSTLAV